MRDYKNIKAYQLADDLVIEVYKMTKHFPKEEIDFVSKGLATITSALVLLSARFFYV